MRTFRPGQKADVKDFDGKKEFDFSTDFTVIDRTEDEITVRDGDDKVFNMKVNRAQNWEWCYHSPSFMVRPPE